MNPLRFRALRVVIGLATLTACLLVLSLDRVDVRPWFREPYGQQTLARLDARCATNRLESGRLFAGFGRVRLTPELNAPADDPIRGRFKALPLAGYGNRKGKPAAGVHDDLFVKAVALRAGSETVVFFGADALIVPREVADLAAERIFAEQGLRREQLYFSATHTHCSFGGWGEGYVGEAFAGPFHPGARVWFAECLREAARQALADLQPAGLAHARFSAPEFVRNRLVGEAGRVDAEFSCAIVKQESGRAAILGSYAAHATVLPGSVMQFSADYPGYWQRRVEEDTGAMAVFLAGAVASHGPRAGEGSFAGAQRMGDALARGTAQLLTGTAFTSHITVAAVGFPVSLPSLNTRITDGLRLRPWISSRLLPPLRPSFLQLVRLGNVLWISTPCDFSGELALDIKYYLRSRGFDAVVTSFNGDYIGYVIPAKYYHLEGYEPRLMSFYGPYVPDYLDDLIRRAASSLAR